MNKQAKFNIGETVIHKRQGYRAVIVDVDPLFQASGRFNPQANIRRFSNKTVWYRLLVDNSQLKTYVKEALLERDPSQNHINNPHVEEYLEKNKRGYHTIFQQH